MEKNDLLGKLVDMFLPWGMRLVVPDGYKVGDISSREANKLPIYKLDDVVFTKTASPLAPYWLKI